MVHKPTLREIQAAHQTFTDHEPRDLFYRAATELVDLAIRQATTLTLAEALGVLLQTWNKNFYRFTDFDTQHFSDIERVLLTHKNSLATLRPRSIESLTSKELPAITHIFRDFEHVLGPVGASKALHLLAPHFFPLWDRAIAAKYRFWMRAKGKNADLYWAFMQVTQRQCNALGGEKTLRRNPLKALDEYNYCKYTKRWM